MTTPRKSSTPWKKSSKTPHCKTAQLWKPPQTNLHPPSRKRSTRLQKSRRPHRPSLKTRLQKPNKTLRHKNRRTKDTSVPTPSDAVSPSPSSLHDSLATAAVGTKSTG